MKAISWIFLGVFLLLVQESFGQVLDKSKFRDVGAIDFMGIEWILMSKSKYMITPARDNSEIVFKPVSRPIIPAQTTFDTPSGRLINANFDEGDGVFMYVPNDKDKKKQVLTNTNILYAFQIKDSVFIITNNPRNAVVKSGLFLVEVQNDRIRLKSLAEFPEIPISYDTADDAIYVATASRLYSIRDGEVEFVGMNGTWLGLNPSNVIAKSATEVYMGIRGGYVKFNTVRHTYSMYMYTGR